MTDDPAVPPTPDEEPSETMTAPAGGKPPVAMRVPAHGRGKLLVAGQPGNKGGGRHPTKLVEQCVTVLGLALDEFERRCSDPAYLATLTVDELRLTWQALAPYVLPKKFEHSGPDGLPIAIEAIENTVGEKLRQRLHTRDRLLHPPNSEPATPPPEPHGVVSRTL
jgi:hypothetical protein